MSRLDIQHLKNQKFENEFREILDNYEKNISSGMKEKEASIIREDSMAKLSSRYEQEFLNPEEALKLGSVSQIVMPGYSRKVLGNTLSYLLRHYKPSAMAGIQRE